jgi:long-chain acyl-CoA synthetase
MHDHKSKNLVSLFEGAVSKFPQREVVVTESARLNYSELAGQVNTLAAALIKLGIKKGDRVVLMAHNDYQFVIAYFGILKAGGVIVPVNTFFKGDELKYILEHSGASFAIILDLFEERFREIREKLLNLKKIVSFGTKSHSDISLSWEKLAEEKIEGAAFVNPEPEDTAAIIYTSGTTGRPKGAMLTHFNLFANVNSVIQAFGSTAPEVMLCVLPLFHAFGATVCMLFPMAIGSKIVIMKQFHPHEALKNISREKVTIFAAVPTMYAMLLNVEDTKGLDFSSWRLAISGGAAMPLEIMKKFEEKFPVLIYEGDGPTECSPVTSTNPIGGRRKPSSIGLPIPGVEMRIVDENKKPLIVGEIGEIAVKGPNVMKGYFNDPVATNEAIVDGWFHTGDIGRVDEDGYFYILDRKKDMVNVGGFNVYPREVEEVIYTHPKVKQVAVIAAPDRKGLRGEIPKAFIILKEGMEMTEKELVQYCHKRLAGFKIPKEIEFCASFPMTASGKIMKNVLKEREWAK